MEASQTQSEQLELQTLKERTDEAVDAEYTRHGYVVDGEYDPLLVEDKMYEIVAKAIVTKRADRSKVALPKAAMMSAVFPQVPGPEIWAEQDEPELAQAVYNRLEGQLWRIADDNVTGKLQGRLNSDLGMLLCRTQATPHRVWAAYVTKDINCLLADFTGPQKVRIERQVDRFAKNLVMAVERLPEHKEKFKRELNAGVKDALGSGIAILTPALEAAQVDEDDNDQDDE